MPPGNQEEGPMKLPQLGGCLCGAVRYKVTQKPSRTWTCHCMQCQRMTSSACSIAAAVGSEGLEIRQGKLRPVALTADSGRARTNWICGECGSWITSGTDPKLAPTKPTRIVLGGTLDDVSWLQPTVHYWTRTKQPWITLPAGDTIHETQDY